MISIAQLYTASNYMNISEYWIMKASEERSRGLNFKYLYKFNFIHSGPSH
jgi:hypothetical protein